MKINEKAKGMLAIVAGVMVVGFVAYEGFTYWAASYATEKMKKAMDGVERTYAVIDDLKESFEAGVSFNCYDKRTKKYYAVKASDGWQMLSALDAMRIVTGEDVKIPTDVTMNEEELAKFSLDDRKFLERIKTAGQRRIELPFVFVDGGKRMTMQLSKCKGYEDMSERTDLLVQFSKAFQF